MHFYDNVAIIQGSMADVALSCIVGSAYRRICVAVYRSVYAVNYTNYCRYAELGIYCLRRIPYLRGIQRGRQQRQVLRDARRNSALRNQESTLAVYGAA